MAETLSTQQTNAEVQIHISGISIATPVGADMSATVNYIKALVDPDTGGLLQALPFGSDNGPQQISLTQSDIVDLLGVDVLNKLKSDLHNLRKSKIELQDVTEEEV